MTGAVRSGRVLALDIGRRRTGLALSDATRTLATPYGVITAQPPLAEVLRTADQLAAESDGLSAIVVGRPLHLDGRASAETAEVDAFVARLRTRTALPVFVQDERLSSVEAERRLSVGERDWRKRKPRLDAAAAAVILQDFLDTDPRRTAPAPSPTARQTQRQIQSRPPDARTHPPSRPGRRRRRGRRGRRPQPESAVPGLHRARDLRGHPARARRGGDWPPPRRIGRHQERLGVPPGGVAARRGPDAEGGRVSLHRPDAGHRRGRPAGRGERVPAAGDVPRGADDRRDGRRLRIGRPRDEGDVHGRGAARLARPRDRRDGRRSRGLPVSRDLQPAPRRRGGDARRADGAALPRRLRHRSCATRPGRAG